MYRWISGSEFVPSDELRGPARLKKTKKTKTADKIDSSQINKNEADPALRNAIHLDESSYLRRKANPREWSYVLQNLKVFGPNRRLDEKAICNYLLDCWWDLRFVPHTRPIYLLFEKVHRLSRAIVNNIPPHPESFESGVFSEMYRSVAPGAADKRVCFFLLRNTATLFTGQVDMLQDSNHFFPVLFDYGAHTAYAFGIWSVGRQLEISVEEGPQSRWGCWHGAELWKLIAVHLGWNQDVGNPSTVSVVIKNWPQVCQFLCYGWISNTNIYT